MPRKPGFAYDTRNPIISSPSQRGKVADVRNMRDQHQVNMNYNTGYMGIASIEGQAYPTITQNGLKKVFESKYVPMDDGNKVLVEPDRRVMYQRGYGNVPNKNPVKVPKGNRPGITHQDVNIVQHRQNAVFTDFPKGAGKTDVQIEWVDGTYEEAVASARRQIRGEIADQAFIDSLRGMGEYALASQTGATIFGNVQVGKEVAKAIAEQEAIGKPPAEATLIRELAMNGVPLVDIRRITEFLRSVNRERYASQLATELNITNPRLIEELGNIMPDTIGLTANAQREAIRRYIEANRTEAQVAQAERDRDRPFMAGATPQRLPSEILAELVRRREAERRSQDGRGARSNTNVLGTETNPNPLINPMFRGLSSRGY